MGVMIEDELWQVFKKDLDNVFKLKEENKRLKIEIEFLNKHITDLEMRHCLLEPTTEPKVTDPSQTERLDTIIKLLESIKYNTTKRIPLGPG